MKTIGLLSDTHSYLDNRLKDIFQDCDEIWHAGDIGDEIVADTLSSWKFFRAVYGNIDSSKIRVRYPEYQILEVEGVSILLIHIAGALGKYNTKVKSILKQYPLVKCIICGHSHILKVQYDNQFNVLYVNPGAAGQHGFHWMKTCLKFKVFDGNIHDLQVVELGKRGKL